LRQSVNGRAAEPAVAIARFDIVTQSRELGGGGMNPPRS